MAKRVITVYVDDLTGEEVTDCTTHTFTLDGTSYELDLGPDSEAVFLQAIEPFRQAATRLGRTTVRSIHEARSMRSPQRGPARIDKAQQRAIRGWWHRNWERGEMKEARDRGRIPGAVVDAYNANKGVDLPEPEPAPRRRRAKAAG